MLKILNCSDVPHICSFGHSKHSCYVRMSKWAKMRCSFQVATFLYYWLYYTYTSCYFYNKCRVSLVRALNSPICQNSFHHNWIQLPYYGFHFLRAEHFSSSRGFSRRWARLSSSKAEVSFDLPSNASIFFYFCFI